MSTPLQPGQTVFFLGDHTSPDSPGYVAIIQSVVSRFYAKLNLRLISAGSPGQTAAALRSKALMDIVTSSKPDWLVIGIGLTDALREPAVQKALRENRNVEMRREQDESDATFGPEFRVSRHDLGPVSDIGRDVEPPIERAGAFQENLSTALQGFASASINLVLLTTMLAGTNMHDTTNRVLRVYNRAIKAAAEGSSALVIDIEKAHRDVVDRALNFKQTLVLTSSTGEPNAQGQALLARTVLAALGILPEPGWRPFR